MSKAEILSALTASGEVSVFRRTLTWEKAFELYNTANKTSKRPSCGSCFRDVLSWLRQG